MARVKAIIIAVLLVGLAGGGAVYGLAAWSKIQVPAMGEARLAEAELMAVDSLRTNAFELIQKLSALERREDLAAALAKLPPTEGLQGDALLQAIKPVQEVAQPLVVELQPKLKVPSLTLIGADGRRLAQAPGEAAPDSLKGLPPVADCLAGVARDGLLELDGKLVTLGASPILDARGKSIGCLLSHREITPPDLQMLASRIGLDVALYLRQKPYASTADEPTTAALASLLDAQAPIRFGASSAALPWLVDLGNQANLARAVRLPSDSDALHLAVILPLAPALAGVKEAQLKVAYATGALLIFGLLLALLLSGAKQDGQARRLLDSLSLMQEQSGYTLDEEGYTGPYEEIVISLKRLLESPRTGGAGKAPATVSQILGKAPPAPAPAQGEMSTSDFESLLRAGAAAEPARPAARPSAPPPIAEPPRPAPPVGEPARPVSAPPPPAPEPAGKGPRVNVPGDLASFFDDPANEATSEVDPTLPPEAFRPDNPPASRPPPAQARSAPPPPPVMRPPAPPSIPAPAAFDASHVPQLDAGDEDDEVRSSDYRPDATVVAQIPDELLKQASDKSAAEPARGATSIPPPPVAGLPRPSSGASSEEAHFKEVFELFLQTKRQCGEPTAGLTLDKFVEKLRSNAAELKARYRCNTVRFQVYVKNGKAALKATPVK